MIEALHLSRRFGHVQAVEEVSLKVGKGEIVGLLGPNGAGKTTTMRMLTGALLPTSGKASIGDKDVVEQSLESRKLLGYLPENNPIYPDISVQQHLQFIARVHGLEKHQATEAINKVLKQLDIQAYLLRPIGTLSKGLKQRVGLAQALLHNPPVLILDEPTSGLDPNQATDVRAYIKNLGQEKAILWSTHILSEIDALADRIYIINRGRVVAEGTPQSLKAGAEAGVKIRVEVKSDLSPKEMSDALLKLDFVKTVENLPKESLKSGFSAFGLTGRAEGGEDLPSQIYEHCKTSGWQLRHLSEETLSLEDVFRVLTKKGESP